MAGNDRELKVFVVERDYYSVPEVIVVVATDGKEAAQMIEQIEEDGHENHVRPRSGWWVTGGVLMDVDTSERQIFVLRPPGNRDLLR